MIELDRLLNRVRSTVKNHELSAGVYARYLWQSPEGDRKMGANEYGCADAANILYMLGDMPRDPEIRKAFVSQLQQFQHPETGLFWEGSHHALHCTAHCTAALELFDAGPAYPLKGLEQYKPEGALEAFLDNLDWQHAAWSEAHQGAGVFAAMILTGEASPAWQERYFCWLTDHTDPEYGMSKTGSIQAGGHTVCGHLNGWFHYLFNFHFAHQPFPRIETLIDTVIDLYKNDELSDEFCVHAGFREIDWVFALNRATMQSGYRRAEAKELLLDFAEKYIPAMEAVDPETDEWWNDLHMLFGMVCAVAELQLALPGQLRSVYPLKQVLDRRPFI